MSLNPEDQLCVLVFLFLMIWCSNFVDSMVRLDNSARGLGQMAIRFITLLGFLVAVGLVSLVGSMAGIGDWYDGLRKPIWNPPGWVFGPVWAVLYLMMAVAAWQVWEQAHVLSRRATAWWFLQLALNGAWSWIFFGLHRPGLALIEMSFLWLAILATIRLFRRVRVSAASLMVPYLAWVSFAWLLNFSIWWMNGGKYAF